MKSLAHIYIDILVHIVRDELNGAHLGAHLSWDLWGDGKTSWMSPYIKFRVNPMPLAPPSVANKFNDFILKEEI